MARRKIVRADELQVGDELDMGSRSWSFKIGSLEDNGYSILIRDQKGVVWRAPGPAENMLIWVD